MGDPVLGVLLTQTPLQVGAALRPLPRRRTACRGQSKRALSSGVLCDTRNIPFAPTGAGAPWPWVLRKVHIEYCIVLDQRWSWYVHLKGNPRNDIK